MFPRSIAVLALAGGCAGSPAPGEAESSIIGGTTDTADPGVVLLVQMQQGGYSLCTAEVVSPHVVMTAAHCVKGGGSFQVFFGDDFNGPQGQDATRSIDVSETHYNPMFSTSNLMGGNDVAVAILSKPAPVTPLPMNRTAMSSALVGSTLRLVGFGITSGSDSTGQSAGIRRQTTTSLTGVDSNFVVFGSSTHNTCQGDSGGPAFIMMGGVEVIAGITSYGISGCGAGTHDTRVDTIGAAFVDPYIAMFDPAGSGGGVDAGSTGGAMDSSMPPSSSPDLGSGGGGPPVGLGMSCSDSSQCQSGLCASVGAGGTVCSSACVLTADSCPAEFVCHVVNGRDLCVRDPNAGNGNNSGTGCSMSGRNDRFASWAGLAVVMLLAGMSRRRLRKLALVSTLGLLVGCGASDGRGRGSNPNGSGNGDGGGVGSGGGGSGGGGGGGPACNPTPSDTGLDQDADGYTPKQGDCNDCDPLVNPGAVEVAGNMVDDDCDGTADNPLPSCDTMASGKNDATSLAQAFEQCDPRFFVSATLVGPSDAKARSVVNKFGILTTKSGSNMALISTGIAADKMGAGYVAPQIGTNLAQSNVFANPLPSIPANPMCSSAIGGPGAQPAQVNDYTELVLKLKAPTNANTFSFQFQFLSAEYPEFVCTQFNDEFLVMMESPGEFTTATNISFDSSMNPITVNNGLFTVCQNGTSSYTMHCTHPVTDIAGTGYEDSISGIGGTAPIGGSTGWLTTTAPVTPREEITLHFIIFDEGDHIYDSAVLIDNFQWSVTAASAPTTIN